MSQSHLHFLLPCLALWKREIVRFLRQRNRVIGAFLTPVIFWVLIGAGVGNSFQPVGMTGAGSYLTYFFPGTLILIVLFTAIFSTISIIEDRREGFLQGVLVAPVSPLAIVGGKIFGGASLALLQALVFCVLSPMAKISFGLAQFAQLTALLILIGVGLTALGYLIAWPLDSAMGFHAIMNIFLIPLWFLSGALFPPAGSAGVIAFLVKINPLYYALATVRHTLDKGGELTSTLPSFGLSLTVTVVTTIVLLMICIWMTLKINRKA